MKFCFFELLTQLKRLLLGLGSCDLVIILEAYGIFEKALPTDRLMVCLELLVAAKVTTELQYLRSPNLISIL